MIALDPAVMRPVDRYRLLIGAVVPRPIAWVTTMDAAGMVNAAPFSFFNGVTANPPIVQVCIAHREPMKDTLRNLRASGEAVVHLVPGASLEAMHGTSADYPSDVSEVDALGLAWRPAEKVRGAILADAEMAFECRLLQAIPVGDPATHLCLLEVVLAHVADGLARTDGLPDPGKVRNVARLGGDSYLEAGGWRVREIPRMKLPC